MEELCAAEIWGSHWLTQWQNFHKERDSNALSFLLIFGNIGYMISLFVRPAFRSLSKKRHGNSIQNPRNYYARGEYLYNVNEINISGIHLVVFCMNMH